MVMKERKQRSNVKNVKMWRNENGNEMWKRKRNKNEKWKIMCRSNEEMKCENEIMWTIFIFLYKITCKVVIL